MKEAIRVLIIDDEENFGLVKSDELKRAGFIIETTSEVSVAPARMREFRPEVLLVNIQMPGMDSITVMGEVSRMDEPPEVIVITGHPTVENAVEAMKLGAVDYITKPFNLDDLIVVIKNTYDRWELKRQNRPLRGALAGAPEWDNLRKVEMEHIRKVLAATGGHRRRAAQILGISERSLYRKIKEFEEESGQRTVDSGQLTADS